MRKKEPALIITFATVTEAMRMEKFCHENDLPGRLVPVPKEISEGCGIAWRAAPEYRELFGQRLVDEGIAIQKARIIEI